MTSITTRPAAAGPTSFSPAAGGSTSGQDLTGECLCCITSGRPLPEHLRAAVAPCIEAATVEAGIGRILSGRAVV